MVGTFATLCDPAGSRRCWRQGYITAAPDSCCPFVLPQEVGGLDAARMDNAQHLDKQTQLTYIPGDLVVWGPQQPRSMEDSRPVTPSSCRPQVDANHQLTSRRGLQVGRVQASVTYSFIVAFYLKAMPLQEALRCRALLCALHPAEVLQMWLEQRWTEAAAVIPPAVNIPSLHVGSYTSSYTLAIIAVPCSLQSRGSMSGDVMLRGPDGTTGLDKLSSLPMVEEVLGMTNLPIATTGRPGNWATVGESCCALQLQLDSL